MSEELDPGMLFGEVRSLLVQAADRARWRKLTELLERWPDPEHLEHVVVPYVCDHLERWDPALREAPQSWLYAMTHDHEDSPFLATLGKLELDARELVGEPSQARCARLRWLAHKLSGVRHLTLGEGAAQASYPDDIASFDELLAPFFEDTPWLAELEKLELFMHDNASSDVALETLCQHFARSSQRLEHLALRAEEVSATSLEALIRLLDANPYIQRVEFKTIGKLDEMLAALHRSAARPRELSLRCYRSCDLSHYFGHEDTHDHAMNRLELALDARRRAEHIECVLTHTALANLSHLRLEFENPPQPDEAFSFAWAARPGVLEELLTLELVSDYLHSSSVDALAERGVFENLCELHIHDASLSEPHTLAELTTGVSDALKTLVISHRSSRMRIDLGATLASPTLRGLKSLECHHLYDPNHGLAKMAGMRHLEGLERLVLGAIAIDDDAARALAGSLMLGNVRELKLSHNGLSEAGLVALSKSFHLYRVESLQIFGNSVTARAAAALASSGWFGRQRELSMSRCELDDSGLRALWLVEGDWEALRTVNLSSNQLSVEALVELCEHPMMHALQWFDVFGNPGLRDDTFSSYLDKAHHLPDHLTAQLRRQIELTRKITPLRQGLEG